MIKTKACFHCKKRRPSAENCPFDIICHLCEREGYVQSEYPTELYGEYASDILEGHQDNATTDDVTADDQAPETGSRTSDTTSTVSEPESGDSKCSNSYARPNSRSKQTKVSLVLGDSNCRRLYISDRSLKNVSFFLSETAKL